MAYPQIGQFRPAEMPTAQHKAYAALAEQILDDGINPFDPQDNGVHLAWLSLYAAANASLDSDDGSVSLRGPSSKSPPVTDLLDLFDGVPTVVFTTSVQLLDIVRKAATKSAAWKTLGVHEPWKRKGESKQVAKFADGQADVLLTTTHRPIGLSYPRARRAIFLQRSWSTAADLWILGALSQECEIITYTSTGTVEAVWHHGLDRLAAMTDREAVRDLVYGREERMIT